MGVGHLEGTELPTGDRGNHTVLTGHRGLPSAKLFTDLDKLEVGDTFSLSILDEQFTYRVDTIRIVEPHEVETLKPVEGEDLVTLVTCTPYGINSHRLLIQGKRTDNVSNREEVIVTADARMMDSLMLAPIIAIPILVILLIIVIIKTKK